MTTVTKSMPRVWVRIAKDRMQSGHYTVWKCADTWICWYGTSDQYHHAKTLGRFLSADEAYVAAERHSQQK